MIYVIEAFGWCMLQVTLFTAIVAGAYGVLRKIRPETSSALLAWSLAVVGLLTMACLSPWPRWDAATWERQMSYAMRDEASPPANGVPPSIETRDDPTAPVSELGNELFEASTEAKFGVDLPAIEAASPFIRRASRALVMVAWIAVVLGLVRALAALRHLSRIRRNSSRTDDGQALITLDALCRQLGIRRLVELRESSQINGAATIGWRRPIVFLPPKWREWTHDELRAVLGHELAHVRQRHFPAWLVSQAVVVAHFYHPIVHWLAQRLRLEQEIDADWLAANLYGDRRQYAATLARLALGQLPAQATFAGVGLFMSRPLLMRRIAMLRQSSESIRGSSNLAGAGIAVLLLVMAIGVAGLRAEPAPKVELPNTSAAPQADSQASPAALPAVTFVEEPSVLIGQPIQSTFAAASNDPQAVIIQALLQIARPTSNPIGYDAKPISDSEWNAYSKSQIPLLYSHFVLKSALAGPEIAALPLVKSQSAPVKWLQNRLTIGFFPDTEILFVEMSVPPDDAEQGRKLVDAVVQAYMENVVNASKQRRGVTRDLLSKHLSNAEDELRRKLDDYYSIAKELQSADDDAGGQLLQQLDMRRLDRVESEIMRLEDEAAQLKTTGGDDKAKIAYYEDRLGKLRERQEELEKTLRSRSEKSIDLSTRKIEVEQLRKLTADMNLRIEMMEINEEIPEQETIRVIQPAVVTDAPALGEKSVR